MFKKGSNIFDKKTYVIVSKWGYPFGGGESFLYTTIEWATSLGMYTYWLCFTDAKNSNYTLFELDKLPNGYIIRIPDGFDKKTLCNWLKLLKPDFVHHQGHMRKEIFSACEELRIEFLSGFHFWYGAIILDSEKGNKDILENYKYHKVDPELIYLYNRKYCNLYTVSPFVTECIKKITGYEINDNIYSSSSIKSTKVSDADICNKKFVTMINVHYLKGGELILYLIKRCKNIPFMCIKTEHYSEVLDEKIRLAIEERNRTSEIKCVLFDRIENPKLIYMYTKILLASSTIDETFCRVVNEAMMNGIPILSTGQGNIKNLMGNTGYILPFEDMEQWAVKLDEIYNNDEILKAESLRTLKEYEKYSEETAANLFEKICTKIILKSKERKIMILTPWCDQGLGIQSKNYANILRKNGYNVFIFALKPYSANSSIELQKDPNEWIIDGCENNVYYSKNDRENITNEEIINFVKKNNIGICLIPETCWFRVFEVAQLLDILNVKCYAIPNIEIVRYDELYKHNYFYKILCNNFLCANIFNEYGIMKTEYVGYGINYEMKLKNKSGEKFKFLFIGGMNAFSRKHILEICESFTIAYEKNKNISLTCTIQKTNLLEVNDKQMIDKYIGHEAITFIQTHQSHNEILNLYYNHHISIQVSKHEGLGLGFYESLATGTPVITLDTPPHNEIIKDNVNGWLIPCYYKKMTDNLHSLLQSAYFDVNILAKKIYDVSIDSTGYNNISKSLMIDYMDRLHSQHFEERFIKSIS